MSDARHPHDGVAEVPNRLPADELRALSRIEPARAVAAIAVEWLGIIAAMIAVAASRSAWVYAIAIVFIGARQHALTVIAHDASHHRLLPDKLLNDLLGNLLLAWPMFISVAGFRQFHGAHHKYLGLPEDGNRTLWRTHDAEGRLRPAWRYPMPRRALLAVLLWHSCGLTGARWVLRGLLGMLLLRREAVWMRALRACSYLALALVLTWTHTWLGFALLWLVPMCTWHVTIQYMRLIAEHSAVASADPAFQATRTTIPTRLEALLMLPRNIGYHIEHHWYPSVPFYRLPDLHARLLRDPRFATGADISHSLLRSLVAVTRSTTSPS